MADRAVLKRRVPEMAGWQISNGAASSPTAASPSINRVSRALRVGSASAPKTSESCSVVGAGDRAVAGVLVAVDEQHGGVTALAPPGGRDVVTARVSRLHAQPLREAASWLNGYQRFLG